MVIIQSRFNSTRLPGKALYPLGGVPMVVFLIRRMRSALPEKDFRIVLATTRRFEDDPIAAWGEAEGIAVVRGHENNVLTRYGECMALFPCKTLVRVTADNPLTCPIHLMDTVKALHSMDADYAFMQGLPKGGAADAFKSSCLLSMAETVNDPEEQEHINLHIFRNPSSFHSIFPQGNFPEESLKICLSIDTPEEYRHVRELFQPESQNPWNMSLMDAALRMAAPDH